MGPGGPGCQTSQTEKAQPGCRGALVGGEVASRGQVGSNQSALLGPLGLSWPVRGSPGQAESPAEESCCYALRGNFPESCSGAPGISEGLGQAPLPLRPSQGLADSPQTRGGLCLPTQAPSGQDHVPPPSFSGILFSAPSLIPVPVPPHTHTPSQYTEKTRHKATSGLFIHMAWQDTDTLANEPGRRPPRLLAL